LNPLAGKKFTPSPRLSRIPEMYPIYFSILVVLAETVELAMGCSVYSEAPVSKTLRYLPYVNQI